MDDLYGYAGTCPVCKRAIIVRPGAPRTKVGVQYDEVNLAAYVSPKEQDEHDQLLLHLLGVVLQACRDLGVIFSNLWILHDRVCEEVDAVIRTLRSKRT